MASGDLNQAINSFTKVSRLLPQSPLPLIALAEAHIATRNNAAAAESLKRALAVAPRNLAELVALAKEKPGGVQFGSGGVGLPHHIAMEQFKRLARIDMVHVPYKGAGPMTSDIVGGNLMLGIGNVTALPLIRGGKLKALAVTASRRIPALAEVPTFSEQGYAIEASGWFGLIGPAGLPSVVVQTLAAASRKVSEDAAFNERLFGLGMRGEATTSEGLAQLVREDTAKWAKLIRDTGVRIDQ